MENNKNVILIRKQSTPFTVNYRMDGHNKEYTWMGTQSNVLNEKAIPFEVFEWLQNNTTTFTDGCLIIKDSDDKDVKDIKENMPELKEIEESILTKDEIKEILTKGNHLSLKKKLDELIENKPDNVIETIKRNITGVAQEEGIDSSAKRKVVAEWAGIEYENSDLLFDKETKQMYEDQAKNK